MSRDEVKYYIDHMDANGLLNLCNDINEWKYKSGKLKPDCTLNHLLDMKLKSIKERENIRYKSQEI